MIQGIYILYYRTKSVPPRPQSHAERPPQPPRQPNLFDNFFGNMNNGNVRGGGFQFSFGMFPFPFFTVFFYLFK